MWIVQWHQMEIRKIFKTWLDYDQSFLIFHIFLFVHNDKIMLKCKKVHRMWVAMFCSWTPHVWPISISPHSINIYYMATIVRALWLAAERTLFSCNDWALWKFFSARRLFWIVRKKLQACGRKQQKRWTTYNYVFNSWKKISIQILLTYERRREP